MLLIKAHLDPSFIHGIGLFADEEIPAGTRIWEFTPELDLEIPPAKLEKLPAAAQEYVRFYGFRSKRTGNYHLSFDSVRFINHSERPNVATEASATEKQLPIVALRAIHRGEEILQDYRDFESELRFE